MLTLTHDILAASYSNFPLHENASAKSKWILFQTIFSPPYPPSSTLSLSYPHLYISLSRVLSLLL